MNRSNFILKGSPHIFGPSVGEVWRRKSSGEEMLLCSVYEPKGFHCIGFNTDFTLNFNHIEDDWMERNEYVKTATELEKHEAMERIKAWQEGRK